MVTKRFISAYCLKGLPFTPKGGTAVVDYGNVTSGGSGKSEAAQLNIVTSGTAVDCQSGETVEVATTSDPNTWAAESFYIVLYG